MARGRRARRSGHKQTKPLYVIAAEGRNTERIYFESFKPGRDGGFRIHWVANPKDKSNPVDVVKRLLHAQKDLRGVSAKVEYWAVIDRDSWEEADLSKAWGMIRDRSNFFLAMSNPCFELWLYLHLRDNRPFSDRHDCQKALEEACPGYEKSKFDPDFFKANGLDEAVRRAKDLDERPDEAWPSQQGTRVYRLVKKLV